MFELPEEESKKVAEAIRGMASSLLMLGKIQSENLTHNRNVCRYIRHSKDRQERMKSDLVERENAQNPLDERNNSP